jgi:diaminopimelate epimerase
LAFLRECHNIQFKKMKKIPFYKYQGTGNDFILLDQRRKQWLSREDTQTIEKLCDRRFGIGADGLILLQYVEKSKRKTYDFEMIYFNADGRESSMCGNGGRATVAFAHFLGIIGKKDVEKYHFWAIDGAHEASVKENDWVELKMIDVSHVEIGKDYYMMNTGSPHFVVFVEDLKDVNVYENGREIRYSDRFRKEGINVNFVEMQSNGIQVATYERGVEAETYSCGTGVTAAAIASYLRQGRKTEIDIFTKGGNLKVRFHPNIGGGYSSVWLCGAAKQVFKGEIWV